LLKDAANGLHIKVKRARKGASYESAHGHCSRLVVHESS